MKSVAARSAALRLGLGASLLTGAWLFLAAMPALADGGPHVAAVNSGASTLTADSCAGCHRAHTAQGQYLINASDEETLCLTCHGAAGVGATANVEDGVQYAVANEGDGQPVAGALRGGGFVNARIDSAHPSRISYPRLMAGGYVTWFSGYVPVRATNAPVTSAHLHVGASAIVEKGVAWGNDTSASGAGPTVDLECATCHNPHGNGWYRILNPVPNPTGDGFVPATDAVNVTDAALPTGSGAAGTRNYTVLWGRTLADVVAGTYPGGGVGPDGGDYWREYLPWDGVPKTTGSLPPSLATGSYEDKPMYVPGGANLTSYTDEITRWCSACHTRMDQATGADFDTGDPVYRYRHTLSRDTECTQCHVAHGSNATMDGPFSGPVAYPDGGPATQYDRDPDPTVTDLAYANSRLLKIDNRGTCQACHDPTLTIPYTNVINSPNP